MDDTIEAVCNAKLIFLYSMQPFHSHSIKFFLLLNIYKNIYIEQLFKHKGGTVA